MIKIVNFKLCVLYHNQKGKLLIGSLNENINITKFLKSFLKDKLTTL